MNIKNVFSSQTSLIFCSIKTEHLFIFGHIQLCIKGTENAHVLHKESNEINTGAS
jgi:hypothetical protein